MFFSREPGQLCRDHILWGGTGSITNSVFADNSSTTACDGIYSVNANGNSNLVNNTFTNTNKSERETIITLGKITVKNNIFNNLTKCLIASGAGAVVDEDYNLFASVDSNIINYSGAVINSGGNSRVVASPRFADPDADNYQLLANSPAIDQGENTGLTIDADKNTRPYGGAVDIGAYEYQGEAVPAISITKAGPAFIAGSGQNQFVLTVINEGSATLDDLQVVDILPTGATYVTGSASDGGTLTGGALTWDLPAMAPNSTQRVWYSVTANQDLLSENYSVSSVSDPSITDSGPVFTTPYNANAVALGFTLFPDSYAFENYTDTLDTDFTKDQMLTFYGPGVCNEGNDSPCVLTTAAETQRQFFASLGSGGHCFGLAMSSLWIYDHDDVFPETYQAGAIHTFDIAKSNARNLIQLYYATQGGDPADQTGLEPNTAAQGGVAVVDKLVENFSDSNADNRYIIGFQRLDGSGGHAVAPYAVNKVDDDTYWIYVYDNNFPNNNDRVFKVNYSTGEWVYEGGAVNPDAPVSDYVGDAEHKSYFFLRSLRWAETFPKKCFGGCVDLDALGAVSVSSAYEFDLTGEGRLMITRDDGLRAGFDPDTGQFIAEIPGAEEILEMHGPLNIPNNIRIPHEEGHTYSVSIADCPTAFGNKTAPADLNIIGDGVVTRLTGLRIDSAEGLPILGSAASGNNDVVGVTLDGDNHALTFQASDLDSDTPDLSMAVSRNGAPDYSFKVTGAQVAQGSSLSVALDVETGKLSIENDDPAENSYNLEVERLDTNNSRLTYAFTSLSDEGSDDGESVDLGENWTGGAPAVSQGEPVTGDLNADGVLGADDYTLIRSSLGKCDGDEGFIPAADFDGDGCVTYADYRIWYGYYRNR